MKKSFWIPAIVLYAVNVVLSDSVQVGTVLFSTADLFRKCWTECDKSLLKARLIIQDILPDPDCIDFSNPDTVAVLLDYFHACYQIISASTYGKLQNLMYVAMSDALGGYLRAYVLPFTRRAYYAGQVKYSEAKKLFQLYDEIKAFLKTNGMGWAEPQKLSFKQIHVTPLAITGGAMEACKLLFTFERDGKPHTLNPDIDLRNEDTKSVQRSKKSKQSFRKNSKHSNSTFVPRYSRNSNKVKRSDDEVREDDDDDEVNVPENKNTSNVHNFLQKFYEVMSMNVTQEQPDSEKEKKFKCDCGNPKGSRSFPAALPLEYTEGQDNLLCKVTISHQSVWPNIVNLQYDLNSYKKVIVPLPILDDCVTPHSIAVPFKKQPLRNLRTRSSAFVLEYYYIAVIKCFIAKGNTRADIKNFNSKFYSWLCSQVYPHLSEEQWYPAFGGVLRIMETIKRFGTDSSVSDLKSHDIGYLFDSGVEFEVEGDKRREKPRNVDDYEECSYSKRHVLTAIILVSMIWIFVFCACAFYFQAARGHNVFYEGFSETSSRRDPRRREKLINFQFLVKFFRRKKNEPDCPSNAGDLLWNPTECERHTKKELKHEVKRRAKEQTKKCKRQNQKLKVRPKKSEKQRLISCGDGNFAALKIPPLDKQFNTGISVWPCKSCLVSPEKLELLKAQKFSAGDFKMTPDQQHRIIMLWKKPSMKLKRNSALKEGRERKSLKGKREWTASETTTSKMFGKTTTNTYSASVEDETKSTDKVSSSCSCSESCQHSPSSTTNTSSVTQVEEKLSSATMEFFEEVISKHKLFGKCPTRKSTDESNREEECSSSKVVNEPETPGANVFKNSKN